LASENERTREKPNQSQVVNPTLKGMILVQNPISKDMIGKGGAAFRKLLRLGYVYTDDGRLVLKDT
jgi:hypothetical protein